MKILIFLIVVITTSSCTLLTHTELSSLWNDFKRVFGKSYTPEEEINRRYIFQNHVVDIMKHNLHFITGVYSYEKGLNEYSDLNMEEHMKFLTGVRTSHSVNEHVSNWIPQPNTSIPDQIDWREKGFVTNIKNQKTCGSCWAFSTTGSLEAQNKKKTGNLISLSEQNLIDCSNGNDGCNGGSIDAALDYVQNNKGIDTESSYPYEALNGTCRFKKSNVGAMCTGRVDLPAGDEDILKQAVAEVGPISVIIDACHNSFISYKSGIFDEPKCRIDIPSHAVLVIGYGIEDGDEYWLVKNSWGKSWGMQGFIKMSRNKNNQCGIASRAAYPLV